MTLRISQEAKLQTGIFLAFLVVRICFVAFSGFDNFELQADTARYNRLSNDILGGSFNLRERFFITAPVYPYFQAGIKLVFGQWWVGWLEAVQLLLAALSGVYLYRIGRLLFDGSLPALLGSALYCFYPFTLWWVHTFGQDIVFQCVFIIAVFYLLKSVVEGETSSWIVFSLLFSVSFLTKSHILLYVPFLFLSVVLSQSLSKKRKLVFIPVFIAICFVLTLPYGLYNLRVNEVYVVSSTGHGSFFLIGNNDDAFKAIVDPPPLGSDESKRLANMDLHVFKRLEPKVEQLSEKEKQSVYFWEGVRWCTDNWGKCATLNSYDLYYFLMPGINPNWYSPKVWLASLIISSPIYLLAYFGIFASLRRDFRKHFWIGGLFATMIIFSVGFYVQNRFRTITIEPFYLLYAGYASAVLLSKFGVSPPRQKADIPGFDAAPGA